MPSLTKIINDTGSSISSSDTFSTLLPKQSNNPITQTTGDAVASGVFGGISNILPPEITTDLQVISDYRLGTFLRRIGTLNGNQASLVDGVIDFIRKDSTQDDPLLKTSFAYSKKFVPIVLVTEFEFLDANNDRRPFYVVFDSTPEELLTVSKSANYNAVPVLGRPEPIQVFNNSDAVSFTLSGKFFASSTEEQPGKLQIANSLFALVTPTKAHYIPTPVEVRIGEWKRLRCIVRNVTIKYEGPWWAGRLFNIDPATGGFDARDSSLANLKVHSPYMYTVTFEFTIVSERNFGQYAEDIIKNGFTDGYASQDIRSSAVAEKLADSATELLTKQDALNISVVQGNAYIYDYQVERTRGSNIEYLKSLGLPTTENSALTIAAHAQITSGLTGEITRLGNKIFKKQLSSLVDLRTSNYRR